MKTEQVVFMDKGITEKLIGEDVEIFSKNRTSQEEKKYEGRILSIIPGYEVLLATGLKASIPVRIPFAGIWEGIFLIYGQPKDEEDRSEGASRYNQLYYNPRVLDVYKFNPWGDSILEDKAARDVISSYGRF